ncbi:hypothetical protein [Hyalangium gracile]|nr:hypothetical protein [Hyalangium gracile]
MSVTATLGPVTATPSVEPGNAMPELLVTAEDARRIAAYLCTL